MRHNNMQLFLGVRLSSNMVAAFSVLDSEFLSLYMEPDVLHLVTLHQNTYLGRWLGSSCFVADLEDAGRNICSIVQKIFMDPSQKIVKSQPDVIDLPVYEIYCCIYPSSLPFGLLQPG